MPFNGYVIDVMRKEDGTMYLKQNVKGNIKMVGVLDDELPCLRHSLLEQEVEQYMSEYAKVLRQIVGKLREKGILEYGEEEKVELRGNNNSAYLAPNINEYIEMMRWNSISDSGIKVPTRKPGILEDVIGISDYNLATQNRRKRLEKARIYTKEDIAEAINPKESEINAVMKQMTDPEIQKHSGINFDDDELPF